MNNQKKNRQLAPILIPPNGFLTIETNLHRALEPILSEHLSFLKKLKLGAILVVNNYPLSEPILSFVDDNDGIAIHKITTDSSSFISNVHLSEDWIKRALELLFSFGQETVLLLGSIDTCIDALIIGCLRKLQKWDMTSILGEFRHLTGRKIFDMEQFIEFIDIKQTRLPRRWLPNYIECYLEIEEEEFNALLEGSNTSTSMNMKHVRRSKSGSFEDDLDVGMPLSPDHTIEYSDSQDTTTLPAPGAVDSQQQNTNLETTNLINSQSQRNYILSLLFEHSNKCITTSNQYDPSVSLITEDTADD